MLEYCANFSSTAAARRFVNTLRPATAASALAAALGRASRAQPMPAHRRYQCGVASPVNLLFVAVAAVLAAIAIAATIGVPAFIGGYDVVDSVAAFPLSGVGGGIALMCCCAWSKGARLGVLAGRGGLAIAPPWMLAIGVASDAAFFLTPFGLGGYASTVFLLRRRGASVPDAAAIMAAEQALDLAFFALAIPVATAMAVGGEGSAGYGSGAVVAGVAGMAAMAAWAISRSRHAARMSARLAAHRVAQRPWRMVRETSRQLLELARGGPLFAAQCALLTIVQWVSRYAVLYLIAAALGHAIPFVALFVMQSVVMTGANVSGLPAGGGAADAALAALLSPWASPLEGATALLVWRGLTLYLPLLWGAAAWAALLRSAPVCPAGVRQ